MSQVAAILERHPSTIESHRKAIAAKLHMPSRDLPAVAFSALVATLPEPEHAHRWSYGFREDWRPSGGFAECVGPDACGALLR